MRWTLPVVLVLVFLSGASRAQDGSAAPPAYRCLFVGNVAEFGRVKLVGDEWVDKRIESEQGFLNSLFESDAEFVLFADDVPRDAFVVRNGSGGITVGFKASWFIESTSEQAEHRVARVAYLLAHQYAHAVQMKLGCTLTDISRERHADLLAGWYLGRRNIATLKGDPPLNPTFAPTVFVRTSAYTNEPFEHGTPDVRGRALAMGFELWRTDHLALRAAYDRGLQLIPQPRVGLAGADAKVAGPLKAALDQLRLKVRCEHQQECTHQVPCTHQKPCEHQVPCQHRVACQHRVECTHKKACTHKVPCVHQKACVHSVACVHKLQCQHEVPCTHTLHTCDYQHDYDYEGGRQVRCRHSIPCTHFRHRCDYQHLCDYEHACDYRHEFDTVHKYDRPHEFDLRHQFDRPHKADPKHEFDLQHKWDPEHDHHLAHEWDPQHDYDVTLEPKPAAK